MSDNNVSFIEYFSMRIFIYFILQKYGILKNKKRTVIANIFHVLLKKIRKIFQGI